MQARMELIMLAGGGSCNKIPHLSKEKLRRQKSMYVARKRTIKPNQVSSKKNHSYLIKVFQIKLI